MTYQLDSEYIELYKLIKLLDLVDSGGQAKQLIENGLVYRNGERAKIRPGETIHIGEVTIKTV
ncbi:MAG: RNA-binding S4 domain-containing protein [Campylobacterales bacterium]